MDKIAPFADANAAITHFEELIRKNFDLLSGHTITHFDEVDTKRYEVRQIISIGCGISAIVMTTVVLEQFLKAMLKGTTFSEKFNEAERPSLSALKDASRVANEKIRSFTLHNAIEKALKEDHITQPEHDRFMVIKDDLRNSFIHSDISKMFDDTATAPVQAVNFDEGQTESKVLNVADMLPVFGLVQKSCADREARGIYEEIDSMIVTISERFWSAREASGSQGACPTRL